MKNTNTAKRLLTTLFAVAAMSLAACGSGSSSADALPEGKIGTVGDGVNASEFAAIQCGMNKDQVTAIVGDAPTSTLGELVWNYAVGSNYTQIEFTSTNAVKSKGTGIAGKPRTTQVNC